MNALYFLPLSIYIYHNYYVQIGSSISFTLISLLKHPNVFEKLTKVLLEAPLTPSHQISEEIYKDHISAQTAKDLPYLNAVINETLRYFPVAAGALPRENDIDIILNNYLIPKGTSILISLFAVMRGSSELNVVDEWSIDKWLEESSSSSSPSSSSSIHGLGEEKEISSFMPFSLGSRNCIVSVSSFFFLFLKKKIELFLFSEYILEYQFFLDL